MQLQIRFRLEPGCLGPTGINYIEDFCRLINQIKFTSSFATLEVVPRYDKSLPEWEYLLKDKLISMEQTSRFLDLHDFTLDKLEEQVDHFLTIKVEQFMASVKNNH